ncbi:MAG TPA: nuclear transport factor 2 family protein [Ferruginibacter sp.]|nr:nuclear transport factor 2 family protein [Ferruginibacter sp.]
MKKITLLLVLFLTTITSLKTFAQSSDEEKAVRACLEEYMSGDGNRMEKAFHPSASMKYIDAQTGEFKDVPIADFIARAKANTNKSERRIEIVSVNIEGNAANGKIKIETDKVILYDYMNMLKVNGEWKIVSKIFSRKNK